MAKSNIKNPGKNKAVDGPAAQRAPLDVRGMHAETVLVHAGTLRSQFSETSEALYLTQGHVYESAEQCEARFLGKDDGFIYARFSNPTVQMFERRMAALEGAEAARATATGMAAVTAAVMGCVRAGDHVVAARALFGSCRYVVEEHLPRYGVETTLVDGLDFKAWKAAIRPNTRLLFLETPANPTLDVIDIEGVAKLAKSVGAILIVDNVFATALWQSPLKLGADCVVYSATKHIDGQGRCLGGVILASQKFIDDNVHTLLRQTGPAMSPFNAWVLLKALETFPLRVQRQSETAAKIADWLVGRNRISNLRYPGLKSHPQAKLIKRQMSGGSSLLAFEVGTTKQDAFRFLNALQIIRISNNLGDAKSLAVHPGTTTHQRFTAEQRAEMGVHDNLVRLSVGLEHADDLIADLKQALKA